MKAWPIVVALLILPTQAFATTYYARTDGNNGNAGTANTSGGAWATIAYGCAHVSAGDTLRVQGLGSTYNEIASGCTSGSNATTTVTLVADGTVNTCGMSFATKSYIRVIGFTFLGDTGGCSANPVVVGSGANTGLEFWNDTIVSNASGKGYSFFDAGSAHGCDKCIWIGGSINNIGGGSVSDTALVIWGDDDFVGYLNISIVCYIGVGPSGTRQRFVNLNFSGMVQCASSHPDFFYIHGTNTLGYSTALVESMFGIGTVTSSDNKTFHAQNQQASAWVDDVWRLNAIYNMGSGVYSMYDSNGALTRWRFYGNTIVYCERANNDASHPSCGNMSAAVGNGLSASLFNNLYYQSWADVVTTGVTVDTDTAGSPTITRDYNLAFSPNGSVSFASQWTNQVHEQSNVDPSFVSVGSNFSLQSGSGARGVGGPLTTATSCSGAVLNVASGTGSFFIGDNSSNLAAYSGKLVPGDFITVVSTTYQVTSISSDAITVTPNPSCSNGDAVYYGSTSTIDIGAYPYKAGGYTLSARYSIASTTATIVPNDASLVRFVVCYDSNVPIAVVNASPYTCTIGSGTFSAKVYPKYPSQTLSVTANPALTAGGPGMHAELR